VFEEKSVLGTELDINININCFSTKKTNEGLIKKEE